MATKEVRITIKEAIFIACPPEIVWDFTQDYSKRTLWDNSVLWAETIQTVPQRAVRVCMADYSYVTFVYKLDERPSKTSLAGQDIRSSILEKCGGSWVYEPVEGGTRWEQTNTLVLKNTLVLRQLRAALQWLFKRQTRRSMQTAKRMLERKG